MSILSNSVPILWHNETDCEKTATQLAHQLQNFLPQFRIFHIWLEGDLGTGKTTFTRYLLRHLGYLGKVKSPTYTLCEPYEIYINQQAYFLHHFDLYRMNSPQEWEEAGFKDILTNPGICLIEWPDKAEGTLPTPDVIFQLNYLNETQRTVNIFPNSSNGQLLMKSMISF